MLVWLYSSHVSARITVNGQQQKAIGIAESNLRQLRDALRSTNLRFQITLNGTMKYKNGYNDDIGNAESSTKTKKEKIREHAEDKAMNY